MNQSGPSIPYSRDLVQDQLPLWRKLSDQGYSLVPLNGKAPTEKNWTRWCKKRRPWDDKDFEGKNAGIACGPASGILVIDVDDAERFERFLQAQGFELPTTRIHQTGSGGRHYIFQYPEGGAEYRNRSCKKHGFDIRGIGGQTVAPGSIHPVTGKPYTVMDESPIAPAPDWLKDIAKAKAILSAELADRQVPASPRTTADIEALSIRDETKQLISTGAPEGERSEAIWRVLCELLGAGLDETQIFAVFNSHPIGEKYLEKGASRESWLRGEIERARNRVEIDHTHMPRTQRRSDKKRKARRLTDVGNGKRFVDRHGDKVRHCHAWRRWLIWNGKRWKENDRNQIMELAKDTARSIYREAASADTKQDRRKIAIHADTSESHYRLEAMLRLASSDPKVTIVPQELDRQPWLLNVRNGTLDLRSGELRPHRREDLFTKIAGTSFDPKAPCERWLQFLAQITNGAQPIIDFLQRALGYTLTGDTSEQVLFYLYGTGENGKSTLIDIIRALLGDYARPTRIETFMLKRNDNIPNDLAALKGARFVPAVEAEEGKRLAESLIKQVTGGDIITARFLHQEWFDYLPQFKVWLAANHQLPIRGTDHAIWRRIRMIPFTVRIPPSRRVRGLAGKLRRELPGILNWALEGCLAWQKEGGLTPPPEVLTATAHYREAMDPLKEFLEDCCVIASSAAIAVAGLYAAYEGWCDENKEPQRGRLSKKKFGQRLSERGFEQERSSTRQRTRLWRGITLREDAS